MDHAVVVSRRTTSGSALSIPAGSLPKRQDCPLDSPGADAKIEVPSDEWRSAMDRL